MKTKRQLVGVHTPIRCWALEFIGNGQFALTMDWSADTIGAVINDGGIVIGIKAPDVGRGDSHARPGKDTMADLLRKFSAKR